jgi:hypothetical protein
MSFDASGTIAGAAVFSKWRGRNYVRRHAVPSNPRTPGQLAARSIVKFLGREWAGLDPSAWATWLTGGDARKISAFNQYISLNARNWRDLMPPSQEYPAARALVPGQVNALTGVASGRQALITGGVVNDTNVWGIVIGRSLLTGEAESLAAAVAIVSVVDDAFALVDGPLAPGTYYYQAASMTTDGVEGSWFSQATVIIT